MIFNSVIAGGGGGGVKVLSGTLTKSSTSASNDKKFVISGIDFTPKGFSLTRNRGTMTDGPLFVCHNDSANKIQYAILEEATNNFTVTSGTYANGNSSALIKWSYANNKLTLDATALYNSKSLFFAQGTYYWTVWGE